jgi:hypothetical protein
MSLIDPLLTAVTDRFTAAQLQRLRIATRLLRQVHLAQKVRKPGITREVLEKRIDLI